MANEGNENGSSVSGTIPTEQNMERAVTNFLQALQNSMTNGTVERQEGLTTIKQFQDLKPTTFIGSPNPLVAEAWVRDMEKIFRALPCTERQKVTFATFTIKDDAQEWWLLTLEKEDIVTWARFLEVFYEKYFPDSLREQKASEFIHLRQETMTVAEYESKFTQLARFATYVIPTEARKARKFEAGLDPEIKDRLEVLKLPTYAAVVDRAYIAEKGIKALRSGEPSQRKRFWERDNRRPNVAPPKRINTSTTSSIGPSNQGPTDLKGGVIPACSTCGRTHWGPCRQDTRACFRYGQVGHLLRNCPKLVRPFEPVRKPAVPEGARKYQKRQGRAFALVPGNP
ncbi:uncharacterized protein LOC114279524 [Camellia sinensis]|uniref:uncharacterized protein LOC114279524 n=1 Tax=Camellia sinensis TaxID=4442 RepID=UPI001035A903|nr:uncharacterized protein LOC114279524 [Camellia sinensis]